MPTVPMLLKAPLLAGLMLGLAGCSLLGPTEQAQNEAAELEAQMADYKSWGAYEDFDGWQDGTSVHGRVVRYYMNDIALSSIEDPADGAIIVKEGYARDRELKAVTVMQKRAGYDPEHNDWFWARYDAGNNLTTAGKIDFCIDCHSGADGDDYHFTNDFF